MAGLPGVVGMAEEYLIKEPRMTFEEAYSIFCLAFTCSDNTSDWKAGEENLCAELGEAIGCVHRKGLTPAQQFYHRVRDYELKIGRCKL